MPRDGSGHSDNKVEKTHDIVHGAKGGSEVLERTEKVADVPEQQKGAALEGMNASGGGNSVKTHPEQPEGK